jgi:hypothetical protein
VTNPGDPGALPLPWVLDHTAILGLLGDYRPAIRLWYAADEGREPLRFPTCAVAEACHQNGTTFAQWESLLWPAGVDLVPLDGSDVFDMARMAGTLAVRHTVVVARQVRGVIVTRAPWQYPPGAVPLRVI